jgi:hypothetical protein
MRSSTVRVLRNNEVLYEGEHLKGLSYEIDFENVE